MASGGEISYLDFEVEIVSKDRDYEVAVLHSQAGEARSIFRLPYQSSEIAGLWKDVQLAMFRSRGGTRRVVSPEEDRIQQVGRALMESLLGGDVRSCWDVTRRVAREQNKRLRLKLRLPSPELAALPWELLYEQRQRDYLSLMRSISVVRYVEQAERSSALTMQPPLRILGVTAAPSDLAGLDVEHERQRVGDALKELERERLVELVWLPGQSWRDLHDAVCDTPWHILHFIGHGYFDAVTDEGAIALVGENGRTYRLSATSLGRLVADNPSLRLVVLNACEGAHESERDPFSSCAAGLVRRGVPAVLAMQYEISDDAAIEFSRSFYARIGQGMPIEAAVSEARIAMSLSVVGSLEWAAPVLYLRVDDGKLFDLPPRWKEHAQRLASEHMQDLEQRQAAEAARLESDRLESERQAAEGRRLEEERQAAEAKVVRVTQRVLPAVPEPARDLSGVAPRWGPTEQPYHPTHQPQPAVRRRRYLGAVVAAIALLVAAGVLVWSWLSDLSHAVGTYERVAQLVARVHYDPVRSEYVCSDGVAAGIVVEVLVDDSSQIPVATSSGLTDKGKTISEGTALLLKVSNGQSCPH